MLTDRRKISSPDYEQRFESDPGTEALSQKGRDKLGVSADEYAHPESVYQESKRSRLGGY